MEVSFTGKNMLESIEKNDTTSETQAAALWTMST
jgi:hypothetical protein